MGLLALATPLRPAFLEPSGLALLLVLIPELKELVLPLDLAEERLCLSKLTFKLGLFSSIDDRRVFSPVDFSSTSSVSLNSSISGLPKVGSSNSKVSLVSFSGVLPRAPSYAGGMFT